MLLLFSCKDALVPDRPCLFLRRAAADCAQNGTYNAVKELLAVVRAPPTPEMELVLAKAEEWQFDSFQLEKFIGGRPLSLLAFYLIKRSELISKVGARL